MGAPDEVDDYVAGLLCPDDDVLQDALDRAEAAGLPAIHVSATQGRLLELLVRMQGAARVLEVGTLAAYSTIWMARGLTGTGRHVTTLEIDPTHAGVARANLRAAGLDDVVEVRVGPATDLLDDLVGAGVEPFDLVFIDADKPSNATYLAKALLLSRPGTVVVVDNVVRQGALADATTTDARVLGSRAVVEAAAADPRLTATVIQTVGHKGYDGFLLLRVDD